MVERKSEVRVFVPKPVLELVDRWVEAGMGSSRSEVIRDILKSWAFGDSTFGYIPHEDRKRYGLCLNNFRVVPEHGGRTCFIGWRRGGKEHGSCKDCPEFVPYLAIVKAFRPKWEAER
jgi:hypothetical protein